MTLRTTLVALGALGMIVTSGMAARPLVENFQRSDRADGPAVLFDNTHAQTAGNADWTIVGAYSDFADALRHHGFKVTSNDHGELDAAKLAGIKVLVVPEPNTKFTQNEKAAITDFVKNGGGLFAIADHWGSDRNGDGIDSPRAWNEFTPTFGITFNQDKHNEDPLPGVVAGGAVTQGVTKLGCWAGCSMTLTGAAKAELKFNSANGGQAFVATSTFGQGRVVAIGDSSPFDDGTGDPHDHLYNGFSKYDIPQFSLNCVNWLAGKSFEAVDH